MTTKKASAFLDALEKTAPAPSKPAEPAPAPAAPVERAANVPPSLERRRRLKHIGGYFDDDVVEKVAILRARLKKDNSELIALAIEELYRKHQAKRAFGDA